MADISRRGFIKSAAVISAMPFVAETKEIKESLKFIHITDSHMDLGIKSSVKAMELMVTFINKNYTNLDFVLFGGDNFNNNVEGNVDALAYKEIVDKIHCPTYHVRGNKESHPKPNDNIHLDEFKQLFMSDNILKVQGKDWLLEKKGYAFLGLDSSIEGADNGLYTKETIEFAKSVLKTGKPTIILNHHPYTNYWNGTEALDIHKYVLGNTKDVQNKLFTHENLIMTLSGHKHIDSITQINKTKVIVTRGFVRPLDKGMYPMRYVEITNNKINEKLIYTS